MTLLLVAALATATPTAAPDIGQVLDWCVRDYAVKRVGGKSILGSLLDENKVPDADRDSIKFICALREHGAAQERVMSAVERPAS